MFDRLTEQQERAVFRRDASVVLSSGAGCGKTHVLTARYLSHLRDDDAEVGQVVAITFTDRAARQMRGRIRQAVVAHVYDARTDADADRWARHLRALETAPISTIHAFCGNLLRQHAVDAGLDPRFDVLEDVLSVNFEAEALTRCLQDLLTDPRPAGEDLRQLVLLYGWKPVVEAVQGLMRAWDEAGWQAWRRPAARVAAGWQTYARTEVLSRHVQYLQTASPKITRCLRLLRETPPLPGSRMADNARTLLEQLPRLAEAADLAAAVEALVEAAKVGKDRERAWPSQEAYEQARDALEGFRDELRKAHLDEFAATAEELEPAVVVGQRFLSVAAEAVLAYRALKRQKGVVDFQDLLVLARNLLRDHAQVRERLRRRYRFLLIDELQDTDPVQMELVHLLCGDGLTAGKLFAVGDHAQAIYRFRGADVRLFQALRQTMPEAGRLGLTRNFRSQPAILEFANALFRDHLEQYEPLRAHLPQVNPGPCVEFLWSPWEEQENVTEGRTREARWIARRIAAMVQGEALVVDRDRGGQALRPVRPGDVVLLFRAMSNVPLYEAALREAGLNYYLVGGRAFFAQQEIYDILNLLRCLENPQDAVSLAGTLRSPFCCLSDEALFLLSSHKQGLWAGLHDDELRSRLPEDQLDAALRAGRSLDRWRRLKDRLPIAGLLGEVFADAGYDAAMQFEFLGDRKLANLWKLVDLARTFDRSGYFGLPEFIQRLGDLVRAQPREEQAATQPENADVVRLMTIHQAKGLEFPVVFVPDVAAAGGGSTRPVALWDARLGCVARPPKDEEELPFSSYPWNLWQAQEHLDDLHEDLRILYVACTRAQDYLVLSAALRQPFRFTGTWPLTLAERFDLQSGAFRAAAGGEPMPRVRVVTDLDGTVRCSKEENQPPAPTREPGPGDSLEAVPPVPVTLAGKRVFEVSELERYWQREQGLFAESSWTADEFAPQYDAEDGSDRKDWVRGSPARFPMLDPERARQDRLLRSVLERWDCRDPDGWQPLLKELGEGHSLDLEARLAAFTQSEIRDRLAAARVRHHDLEVLADWPMPDRENRPVAIRGVIDCLWQDGRKGWHVLAFTWEGAERRDLDRRRLGLWAWALRRRSGVGPRTATLYSFAENQAVRWSLSQLRLDRLEEEVNAALSAIARLTLSPGPNR
jgi:ATP-dependent helicase/nuclease subunit A